mmetsp:Transcript_4595/g.6849  ORF Transcript_4595/g.6849 Transcript_4595/m.6849 type:complete len:106 (+) Transcript_4595:578-895(+)
MPGYVVLTNPNQLETFSSAEFAVQNGCRVLDFFAFLESLLSFILVMATVYWVVGGLQRWSNEKHRLEEFDENLGKMECSSCIMMISNRAKRCPHCTSFVTEQQEK